jgi:hypothetical protein
MKRFKTLQTCLAFMMLILSVSLITGCSSSSSDAVQLLEVQSGSVNPGTCTKAGPAVTSSNPTDGDVGVTTSKLITVKFS